MNQELKAALNSALIDISNEQIQYSASPLDARSIRDVVIHAYRPVLAVVCTAAGEEWPPRPALPETVEQLLALLETMYQSVDDLLAGLDHAKLAKILSLPWSQQMSGLEAINNCLAHGLVHAGVLQGIRACGGFPVHAEGA